MKKALLGVLVLLVAAPVFAAISPARLYEIAANDIIPEIRMAAGFALINLNYFNDKSEAELMAICGGDDSEAIKMVASAALSKLWIGAGKSKIFLLNVITGDDSEYVRLAAIDPILEYLIGYNDKALQYLINNAPTFELRYAAAKAFFHNHRGDYKTAEALEEICNDEDKSDGFRKAAADLLAGVYQFPPATAKSQADLEDQALNGANEYLRYAAAKALSTHLIKSDLDETALWQIVTSFYKNPSFSAEYKWAYELALGSRWAG
ncbi:hypothetical protein DRJ54_03760 [Candidatus Acetothermia bacterium]|nr:MAG: hypothetical protein DRJ54_03760 [Candidatus Acetothermia bacterium]HDN19650.1 hypothetical protein [Candidatus Acetothermia bacterium]